MDSAILINNMISLMLTKEIIPSDFHSQANAVNKMLSDDVTGLVDSLTDFAVESASVNYTIETDNERFTKKLRNWLNNINVGYNGQVPIGIKFIAEEYFKERWKGASFPVLKITDWESVDGILLPTKMFFVDGASIYAHDIDKDDDNALNLVNYKYTLGKDDPEDLTNNVIITKPFGRWFEKYPRVFLVKRGVYHNWRIVVALKKNQTTVLEQIIPYLLLIKKGTENLALKNVKTYGDKELEGIIAQFQTLIDDMKTCPSNEHNVKSPVRATMFDEEIKHLIPDLESLFKTELFEQLEKNILGGMGFIDVIQGTSSTRRESILNPVVFVEEVKQGVEDFKAVLNQLVYMIIAKNKEAHVKYMNSEFYVDSSPVRGFMSDKFKEKIRQLYDRGLLSKQTTTELIGEISFRTEVHRREKEAEQGLEITCYPPITKNVEDKGIDFKHQKPGDKDEDNIPDDKKDEIEKKNYDIGAILTEDDTDLEQAKKNYIRISRIDGTTIQPETYKTYVVSEKKGIKVVIGKVKGKTIPSLQSYLFANDKWTEAQAKKWVKNHEDSYLEGAPYKNVQDLPDAVRNNMPISLQRVFLRVFNQAYNKYKNDTRAFRIAWGVLKKIAIKKNGKWIRKSNNNKTRKAYVNKKMVERAMIEIEKEVIDETFKNDKQQLVKQQLKIANKLLNEN